MIKKTILGILVATQLLGAEPLSYGAARGDLKFSMQNLSIYPNQSSSSAGNLYLYKNNKSEVTYINETKNDHIISALEEAKQQAKDKNKAYYAIDNVTHQVIMTENQVVVLTDYNVLAFD
ncbi:MAG: hypothetical protein RBR54_04670 [Sulfurimonas sp.]|jgi:hypothetical protein|nr:hypothetical protein [Sulfurimonas sp.]